MPLPTKTMQNLAAVCSAMAEAPNHPMPESYLYLAIGADLPAWEEVKAAMIAASLATFEADTVTLTEKGQRLGEQINARLAQAQRPAA
jgi:hypothetical protein